MARKRAQQTRIAKQVRATLGVTHLCGQSHLCRSTLRTPLLLCHLVIAICGCGLGDKKHWGSEQL